MKPGPDDPCPSPRLAPPGSDIPPAPSGVRPPLEASVLDELLDLAIDLPVENGAASVARHSLERLSRLMPGFALGLCIVDSELGEQFVEVRVPEGVEQERGHDPSRLFPTLAAEQVFPMGGALAGSTFHLASNDAASLQSAQTFQLATRAVLLVESAVRRARALERAIDATNQLRRLQSQVIQAEKLASLGQIVAGVVHELNNPLTSIIAYADYLARRLSSNGSDAGDVERAERISEAAMRIQKFSRDLIAYARPTSDVPGPVTIHEVIEKALVFCEHELDKHSVTLERRLHEDVPLVRGIGGQLTQVFVNLFTNAAQAMAGRGGRLCIVTAPDERPGWVRIEILDEGVGIAPDNMGRIFEPFFTTKPDGQGTGLGLSIVRDIVMAHGGTLSVTSTPGEGSVFVLLLPAAARPPSSRPPDR
jgi:signal transduction histidine kinase